MPDRGFLRLWHTHGEPARVRRKLMQQGRKHSHAFQGRWRVGDFRTSWHHTLHTRSHVKRMVTQTIQHTHKLTMLQQSMNTSKNGKERREVCTSLDTNTPCNIEKHNFKGTPQHEQSLHHNSSKILSKGSVEAKQNTSLYKSWKVSFLQKGGGKKSATNPTKEKLLTNIKKIKT